MVISLLIWRCRKNCPHWVQEAISKPHRPNGLAHLTLLDLKKKTPLFSWEGSWNRRFKRKEHRLHSRHLRCTFYKTSTPLVAAVDHRKRRRTPRHPLGLRWVEEVEVDTIVTSLFSLPRDVSSKLVCNSNLFFYCNLSQHRRFDKSNAV